MAIAGIYNITMDQGAQWTLTVVYDNNNGTPIDLTGYTARMQIRNKLSDTTYLLDMTTENGRIILNNSVKTIELKITATDTTAITWTSGVYSLELLSAGVVVSTLMNGTVTVKQEVTR